MPSISTFSSSTYQFYFHVSVTHFISFFEMRYIMYKTATYMVGANSDTFKLDNGPGEAEFIIVGIRSLLRHGTLLYLVKRTRRKRHRKRPKIDLENVQNLTNFAFGDNNNIIFINRSVVIKMSFLT